MSAIPANFLTRQAEMAREALAKGATIFKVTWLQPPHDPSRHVNDVSPIIAAVEHEGWSHFGTGVHPDTIIIEFGRRDHRH